MPSKKTGPRSEVTGGTRRSAVGTQAKRPSARAKAAPATSTRAKSTDAKSSSARSTRAKVAAEAAQPEVRVQVPNMVSPAPGSSVVASTRLPGGILMQWGRSRAPLTGVTQAVTFAEGFEGTPVVTSSWLYDRPISPSEHYLIDVHSRGFTWRNQSAIGELLWMAVGAAAT